MCGKDNDRCGVQNRRTGSPPHVRERQGRDHQQQGLAGIPPACAGKTRNGIAGTDGGRDHPRMCGKDRFNLCLVASYTGSPPHVRERQTAGRRRLWYTVGSPPHVRERHQYRYVPGLTARITPACAGKTIYYRNWPRTPWDHPRMCGKDAYYQCLAIHLIGSPPHVRERLNLIFDEFDKVRITPACAGKTAAWLFFFSLRQDHPRMCGKDIVSGNAKFFSPGSPPHVRERHRQRKCQVLFAGITPACAGKTLPGCLRRPGRRDHPRMCGKD